MIRARHSRWWLLGSTVAGLALLVSGFFGVRGLFSSPTTGHAHDAPVVRTPGDSPRVETVRPTQGGLAKRTIQPGSAHSFESAELYAKISGFLKEQRVDIGSHVKRGDLLAEIDIPELAVDLKAAEASLKQAEAEVTQAKARVESMTADQQSAQAKIAQTSAEVDRCEAEVGLAQKKYDRIRELNALKGIEDRIVDEHLCQLQSAQAAQRAARSAVTATEQQAVAAEARIALAKAELLVSEAKVAVAESQRDRAEVLVSYTRITSPYDGVVTCRNFHRGAYVRSPDHGGQVPLLTVDRTDHMRVLVRIPEREVPFVQAGDKATIHFDALPQREFQGSVARVAESEDPATRTMQVEVDLPNDEGLIRDHMYGRVEIALEVNSQAVTIPSTCLVGDVSHGRARLFVVDGRQASLKEVRVGKDTGIEVEVLSGISATDMVVLRPSGDLTDGDSVAGISRISSAAKLD